jgi:hypothetical protein
VGFRSRESCSLSWRELDLLPVDGDDTRAPSTPRRVLGNPRAVVPSSARVGKTTLVIARLIRALAPLEDADEALETTLNDDARKPLPKPIEGYFDFVR